MSSTVVTPTTAISGDHHHHHHRHLRPRQWVPLLELCKQTKEYSQLHSTLIKLGLIHNTLLSTRLASSLALSFSPSNISYAHQLFDRDPNPNSFAYNVLIRAYSKTHQPIQALTLFIRMLDGISPKPNSMTFPFLLNACSTAATGRQLHALSLKFGLQADVYVNNSLISMYVKAGTSFLDALKVFDRMPQRCWSFLVRWLVWRFGWISSLWSV